MSNSAKWVTEWIMPQLGNQKIQSYLEKFSYGNKDFSGGLKEAWQTTSLKISAHEQMTFIKKLWKDELLVSKRSIDLTKKIIFIEKLGNNSDLYGKTGTGCLEGHACMDQPDRMLGWFVGILKNGSSEYAIAANASDLTAQSKPAGPRLRQTVVKIVTKMNLVK